MKEEETKLKLGICFAAVNLTAIVISTVILLKIGVVAGITSFFIAVTTLTFVIQRKTAEKLSENN